MKIVTNEKLIKRNTRIAQIASFSGLLILVGGMVISFTREELINLAFIALLLGFLLSQVGIYFTNRWGRRPRPDEVLDQSLKGLDNKYALYHYTTSTSHLLVGPAGIWTLLPRHQRGRVVFSKGRWRQRGGGFLQGYLRIFAQEGLGRPDLEIPHEIEKTKKFLEKKIDAQQDLRVNAALVFTNDQVQIEIDEDAGAIAPTLKASKLKEFIRRQAKNKPISLDAVQEIQEALGE